jgi:hypothetical protein
MAYTVTTLAATSITSTSAVLNLSFTADSYVDFSCQFDYRVVGAGGWDNTVYELVGAGNTYSKSIIVVPSTDYEFKGIIIWPDNSLTGSTLTFTSLATADRAKTVKDIVTLEAIRNIEMTARGRLHVDAEGNLVYESRFRRLT